MLDNITENRNCNVEPATFTKELKSEILRVIVGFAAAILIGATLFYFNTQNSLKVHEATLNQLQRQIEAKADQGAVEKRLDRIENKIDDLINYQINTNHIK